jgi:hypothetical protein
MESSSRAIRIAGTTTMAERGKSVIVPFSHPASKSGEMALIPKRSIAILRRTREDVRS